MNPPARESRRYRSLVLFAATAVAAPLLLCQCKSSAGNFQKIEYDPATLKTPDDHGMQKKDYPFDDDGNYRKDWVKNNTSGRTKRSYDVPDAPPPAPEGAPASATVAPVSETPAEGGSTAAVIAGEGAPAAPAAASSPQYHRVGSGDTLYSLAQRYGTSVDDLKRVNGLTSNSIRAGQSLRIP